jgi:hypothetical protein
VQDHIGVIDMRVLIEMVNALGIKRRGSALNAVHDIAFFQKELSEVGTILASNAGDEGNFLIICHDAVL